MKAAMFKQFLLTSTVAALLAAQPNSEPNPYRTVEHWYHAPRGTYDGLHQFGTGRAQRPYLDRRTLRRE